MVHILQYATPAISLTSSKTNWNSRVRRMPRLLPLSEALRFGHPVAHFRARRLVHGWQKAE